jgi:hypothetical protein
LSAHRRSLQQPGACTLADSEELRLGFGPGNDDIVAGCLVFMVGEVFIVDRWGSGPGPAMAGNFHRAIFREVDDDDDVFLQAGAVGANEYRRAEQIGGDGVSAALVGDWGVDRDAARQPERDRVSGIRDAAEAETFFLKHHRRFALNIAQACTTSTSVLAPLPILEGSQIWVAFTVTGESHPRRRGPMPQV